MARYALPFVAFLFSSVAGAQQYVISTIAGGAPPPTPAAATQTSIGDPPRVAVDSSGNVFFGGLHSVFRVDSNGTIVRIAGNGKLGYSGDGGAATAAQLNYPTGIAVDAAGNVYVADRDANVVRMISPSSVITTFAGTGLPGYQGDGDLARQARLTAPMGLALDSAGNLYIADSGNHVIRKVSNGTISTVAGNGIEGYGGDGGPATAASLDTPQGVVVDRAGLVYIADTFNNRVRVVSQGGTISTYAGTGSPTFALDGSPTSDSLFFPADIALDTNSVLYIADLGNSRIRKFTGGTLVTVAGGAGSLPPFGNAVATAVHLNGPTGLAIDGSSNIYFAEGSIGSGTGRALGDYRIWKVNSAGSLSIAAGNGIESFSGDGGPAAVAQMNAPSSAVLDSAGNLYFSDTANNRVRKIAPNGSITTVAGTATPGFSGDTGPATAAQLNGPTGLAVDLDGNLYIADTNNNRIRKVLGPSQTILTIVGNGNAAYFGDGGISELAAIHAPQGVAIDPAGNLYIADTGNQRIRKILQNGMTTTLAGTGVQGAAGDGGPAASAQLNLPSSIGLDSAGNVFVADSGNGSIRKISTGGTISTVASGYNAIVGNGASLNAPPGPQALAVDSTGNVFFADSANNRVRVVTPNGSISTLAGDGVCCYTGDGGPAAAAELNSPWGVAVDAAGRVYVVDSGNSAIRLIQPSASAVPVITAVANGASNAAGPVAPGEIVVLFGSGLGPLQLTTPPGGASPPQTLSGVNVTFNGATAQLLYVSAGQLSAIVPPGLSGSTVQVVVQYFNASSAPFSVGLAAAAPAIFTANAGGSGQAVAFNQDSSVNSAANPAPIGSAITLLVNGSQSQLLAGPLSATVAGYAATVVSSPAGLPSTPGITPVSIQIPGNLAGGPSIPVVVSVGTVSSQVGVTIAIAAN